MSGLGLIDIGLNVLGIIIKLKSNNENIISITDNAIRPCLKNKSCTTEYNYVNYPYGNKTLRTHR